MDDKELLAGLNSDFYQQLFAFSPYGISVTNVQEPDQPLVYVNHTFEKMTGYSASEVVGKNCRFLQGQDKDQTLARSTIRDSIKKGKACKVFLINYRKDSTLFYNELYLSPVYNRTHTKLTHFMGFQSDVTHRVQVSNILSELADADVEAILDDPNQLEALISKANRRSKMQAIGAFAAGINHNFNNTLFSIGGNAKYLKNILADNQEAQECLDDIISAVEIGKQTISEIKDFSNPVTNPELRKHEHAHTNIAEAMQTIGRLASPIIPQHISFTCNISCVEELHTSMPRHQLEQIIMNLIKNSCDAITQDKAGVIKLEVSDQVLPAYLSKDNHHKNYVCIELSDNGAGIDKKIHDKVFDPFFTTKGPSKGTGLGLSTSYTIIKQYGGYIEFDSKPGMGTHFSIYLPIEE